MVVGRQRRKKKGPHGEEAGETNSFLKGERRTSLPQEPTIPPPKYLQSAHQNTLTRLEYVYPPGLQSLRPSKWLSYNLLLLFLFSFLLSVSMTLNYANDEGVIEASSYSQDDLDNVWGVDDDGAKADDVYGADDADDVYGDDAADDDADDDAYGDDGGDDDGDEGDSNEGSGEENGDDNGDGNNYKVCCDSKFLTKAMNFLTLRSALTTHNSQLTNHCRFFIYPPLSAGSPTNYIPSILRTLSLLLQPRCITHCFALWDDECWGRVCSL